MHHVGDCDHADMAYTDMVLVIISESVVCESLLAQLIMEWSPEMAAVRDRS